LPEGVDDGRKKEAGRRRVSRDSGGGGGNVLLTNLFRSFLGRRSEEEMLGNSFPSVPLDHPFSDTILHAEYIYYHWNKF
jgi:hypothetical protein